MGSLTDFLQTATQGATGILGALGSSKAASAEAAAAEQQAAAAKANANTMSAFLKWGLIGGGVVVVLVVVGLLFKRK